MKILTENAERQRKPSSSCGDKVRDKTRRHKFRAQIYLNIAFFFDVVRCLHCICNSLICNGLTDLRGRWEQQQSKKCSILERFFFISISTVLFETKTLQTQSLRRWAWEIDTDPAPQAFSAKIFLFCSTLEWLYSVYHNLFTVFTD